MLNVSRLIAVIIILLGNSIKCQDNPNSIKLSENGTLLNQGYLEKLDDTFKSATIIGLGESTHGTSQFTTARGEIFKYLVNHHNFTHFFLEADYNACARINRYINGEKDNAQEALFEVCLWPWITEEMIVIIDWMKEYNLTNNNQLQFMGCDMQLIRDDAIELKRIIELNTDSEELISAIPSLDFDKKDSNEVVSKHNEWKKYHSLLEKSNLPIENLATKTIDQWFDEATSTQRQRGYRDSCMGNNIADYVENHPGVKGIYFAHNGHVSLRSNKYYKAAGSHLKDRLGNQYTSIALEFYKGSFNAINYKDEQFVMEEFSFEKSKKKSIANYVLGDQNAVYFLSSENLPKRPKLEMTGIGAIYGESKSGYKIHRYRTTNSEQHDAFIVFNNCTPTQLLRRKKNTLEK